MKKKTKIVTKIVEMKVKDFIEYYNKDHDKKINRNDVYKMIKDNTLKAHKGEKGAWIIEVEQEEEIVEEVKSPSKKSSKKVKAAYSVKEFVEEYNKKHSTNPITTVEARKLIADEVLQAEKVSGKWVITSSPSKRIKL